MIWSNCQRFNSNVNVSTKTAFKKVFFQPNVFPQSFPQFVIKLGSLFEILNEPGLNTKIAGTNFDFLHLSIWICIFFDHIQGHREGLRMVSKLASEVSWGKDQKTFTIKKNRIQKRNS